MHSADCWKRLGAQFDARALLEDAERLLSGDPEGAIPARHVRAALARLHPITADPQGVAEYEARRDGTYVEPTPELVVHTSPRSAPRASTPDPRDALIKDLAARLATLERRDHERAGAPPAPSSPPESSPPAPSSSSAAAGPDSPPRSKK